MKKSEFAAIAFCTAGIFSVVKGLVVLRGPLQMVTIPGDFRPPIASAAFVIFLAPVVLILLGVVLIAFADKLGRKLLPDGSQEQGSIILQAEELRPILFSFAGLLLIGFAIAPTLDSVARLIDLHNNFYFGGENQLRRLARDLGWTLAGGGLQLLFGIALLFQWNNKRGLLRELRPMSSLDEGERKGSDTN